MIIKAAELDNVQKTLKSPYIKRTFRGPDLRVEMSGKKCGRLTVVEYAYTSDKRAFWKCVCECGSVCIIFGKSLRSGATQSCGCLQRERASKANKTHGKSKTRLYAIWEAMKRRTGNSNQWNYKYYGGRGIKLCNEWKRFEVFQEWAVKNGYQEKLSIERVDVDGNYEPKNCTWIPVSQQQSNKRNSLKYAIRRLAHQS